MAEKERRTVEVSAGGAPAAAAGAGIVVALLFLAFGVGFIAVVLNDMPDSEDGLRFLMIGFGAIWVVACLAMVRTFAQVRRGAGKAAPDSLLHIEDSGGGETAPEFETRLRGLEALRKDGLVSEDEYRRKRAEMLDAKW